MISRGLCCCIASGLSGSVLICLACLVIADWHKYTPLYQDVVCRVASVGMDGFSAAPLEVSIKLDILCTNPNPYDLQVPAIKSGQLLVGPTKKDVGTMSGNGGVLPAAPRRGERSEASLELIAAVQLTFMETLSLSGMLLSGPFEVFFELRADLLVAPTLALLLKPMTIDMPVEQKCGMWLQLMPNQASGDAVCGSDDFSALSLTPIGEGSATSVEFQPKVDEGLIEEGEASRDTMCRALMIVLFVLGSLLLILPPGVLLLWRLRRPDSNSTSVTAVPPSQVGKPEMSDSEC